MRGRVVLGAWLAVSALTLAGCTGSSTSQSLPSESPTSTTTPASPATTASSSTPNNLAVNGTATSPITWFVKKTGDPAKDAALSAAQKYWSLTTKLHEKPNPADPELARVIADPQLSRVVNTVTDMRKASKSQFGPSRISLRLGLISATTARVDTCIDNNLMQVFQGKIRLVGAGMMGIYLYQLTLRRVRDGWVATDQYSPGKCTITKYQ